MQPFPDDGGRTEEGVPTARRLWGALLMLLIGAACLYGWMVSRDGGPQVDTVTSSNGIPAALLIQGQPDVEPTTSASIANPFSTFQQGPANAAATASLPPPAEPFTFVAKRIESGTPVVILLQRGRHVAISGVGRIDDIHEVEAFDELNIVLLHLPSMTRQTLALQSGLAGAVVPAIPALDTWGPEGSGN